MSLQVLPDILVNLETSHRKPALLRFKADGAYRDLSTDQVISRVQAVALGLNQAGVGRGDRVALLSENRPEWTITDLAVQSLGAVTVPLYQSLLTDQIRFILGDCGAVAILVSDAAQLAKLRPARPELPELRTVVVFDPPEEGGDSFTPWSSLCEGGGRIAREQPERFEDLRRAVRPEDVASIIYTSGTTGIPKGVVLTHANFVSNVKSTMNVMPFEATDVCLSFLPLAHVFERMVEYAYLARGATIAYAESFETVPQNLVEVRPSLLAAVPRVFEKFYARIMKTVADAPALRRKLFHWAVEVGLRRVPYLVEGRPLPLGLRLKVLLAQRLVFAKIQGRLGGRVRFFLSGSAKLSPDLSRFFWGIGLPVFEGYGMTETSPVISLNYPGRVRLGTVGPIIPGVEVQIAADGEIKVRGPNVMREYYRNDEATHAAFEDGWLCTGDVGELDDAGFLTITDRKKDLIKTSGGKLVAPQPLENALKSCRYVANAVIIGEGRKFISALLIPDFERLQEFCSGQGLSLPPQEQIRHAAVVALYEREIERLMERRPRYERIKAFRLLTRDFSEEDGEITPTLKVRRSVVEKKHEGLIREMYPEEPAPQGA